MGKLVWWDTYRFHYPAALVTFQPAAFSQSHDHRPEPNPRKPPLLRTQDREALQDTLHDSEAADNHLRHSKFISLREAQNPGDVVKEQ